MQEEYKCSNGHIKLPYFATVNNTKKKKVNVLDYENEKDKGEYQETKYNNRKRNKRLIKDDKIGKRGDVDGVANRNKVKDCGVSYRGGNRSLSEKEEQQGKEKEVQKKT